MNPANYLQLIMQFTFVIVCAILAVTASAHDSHEHVDQMPMNYVKYPYQAVYPGDNEGIASATFLSVTIFIVVSNSDS